MFPLYVRMRADSERLAAAYLRVIRAIALVAFPLALGVTGAAGPFIDALFGEAWSPAVPVLLILGPLAALQAIGTTVGHVYQATGRTDLMFKWGAGAGILLVAAFAVGLRWGIVGVAACYAIVSYALAYPLFKIPLDLIGVSMAQLARAVSRALLCSVVTLVVMLALRAWLQDTLDDAALLTVLVAAGTVAYAWGTWLFNRDSARELLAVARRAE
jgi:PST family polysaccharide transporter